MDSFHFFHGARPYIENVQRAFSFLFCGEVQKLPEHENYEILNGLRIILTVLYKPYISKQSMDLLYFFPEQDYVLELCDVKLIFILSTKNEK